MRNQPFVHLHMHTCFSLLDGACRLEDIMETATRNDMPAVAITDHGVMHGIIDFYKTAKDHGIKPILGCETYVAPGSHLDRKSDGSSQSNHLVLLAKNETGYRNLIRLISTAHLEGFYYKPRIDKELLARYHEGLIGLSACLKGEVASCLLNDDMKGAIKAAGEYSDILGKENFYLEVQDHLLPEQSKVNKLLPELALKTGLPIVATNDVHYIQKEHAQAHEVLLCLQTQTVMSDPNRMRYRTQEFYMKTRAEMEKLFKEFPGSLDLTLEIAEKCNVELEFGQLHFPIFQVAGKISQEQYLINLGMEGLKKHYNVNDPLNPKDQRERGILERFNTELSVIKKTGYINYYLVVWDFVNYARHSNIPVGPGRGSGGGSLIAYLIGITTIDPLEYDLVFERFLNPERVSPPDFDIDFCQNRRGEVIEYVKQKYGTENVAQIVTFGSLGAKTAIRDVGRVLEIPYSKCDLLSKMVPEDPKMTLKLALDMSPDLKKMYKNDADCKRIMDYAFVLEGLYRNPGTHAAGVVIGEKPLIEIIPLARDKEKNQITQYSMEPLGEIGLLKMDFLGLKTLTVIHETVELIKEFRKQDIDIESIPIDDKPTYELLNRGDTIGVFQLESAGMRDLIRRVGINNIRDLIAMIALYRPGPMNMLDDYVNRKGGKSEIKYDHALLEPILNETYGIMLYQEQVLQVAHLIAGYSLGEADILRRAMGKKKPEVMEKQREKFINGCKTKSKIEPRLAGKIFDTIAKFAGYGFCKAHSTGYGIIAYQTAYLKANYPAEFMAALLSSEMGNPDKLPVFITEASEMGLEILGPDINASRVRFVPYGNSIRFGLAGVKNIGEGAAKTIVDENLKNGPYSGLINFCLRIDIQNVNKKVMESLIRSGGFDSTNKNRARLFNGLDFAISRASSIYKDKQSGQGNLFNILEHDKNDRNEDNLPDCANWHENDLLSAEKELLGVYMSGHPLTQHAYLTKKYQLASIQDLKNLKDKSQTRLCGIISQLTAKITKTKKNMAIFQLETLNGDVEVVVFPETYQNYGTHIKADAAVIVCGEVSTPEETPKIIALEIYPLTTAPRYFTNRIGIHIPSAGMNEDKLVKIKNILNMHPGNVPVTICVLFPSGEKVFLEADSTCNVLPDEDLIKKLVHELGEKMVYVAVNPSPCKNPQTQKRWTND